MSSKRLLQALRQIRGTAKLRYPDFDKSEAGDLLDKLENQVENMPDMVDQRLRTRTVMEQELVRSGSTRRSAREIAEREIPEYAPPLLVPGLNHGVYLWKMLQIMSYVADKLYQIRMEVKI